MDLDAYAQIDVLSKVAEENNISVPRLRGYRLMSEEEPVSKAEIKEICSFRYYAYDTIERFFVRAAVNAETKGCLRRHKSISKSRRMAKRYVVLCTYTDRAVYRYFDYYGKGRKSNFDWTRFHGKLRKKLKLVYKQCMKRAERQYELWNKYVGRSDILYIHARIGGGNWPYYKDCVINEPWFLEKVDDCFDDTYCDIYAKIRPCDEAEKKKG